MKNGTGSEKSTERDGFLRQTIAGNRIVRCQILWTSLLLLSWLLMQSVHEFGHVLGAWLTGGRVVRVDLHPLRISQTFVSPNPSPLFVCWSGPIFGALFPLILWITIRNLRQTVSHYFCFFAGFCLIANGAYLGMAGVAPVGDARDLLSLGVSSTWMLLFGVITIPTGFWLWNGQGKHFGIGPEAKRITPQEVFFVSGFLVMLIAIELLIF